MASRFEGLEQQFADLKHTYQSKLDSEIDAIKDCSESLLKEFNPERAEALITSLSTIASTARMFGLREVSSAANQMETQIQEFLRYGESENNIEEMLKAGVLNLEFSRHNAAIAEYAQRHDEVIDEDEFYERLSAEQARASRYNTTFSLIVLEVKSEDSTDFDALLEVVSNNIRKSDIAASFPNNQLAVILSETLPTQAQRFYQKIKSLFYEQVGHEEAQAELVHAGIVSATDTLDEYELTDRALAALRHAIDTDKS